jgi:hypothetical protein
MRFVSMTRLSLLAIVVSLLFSCTKKTETFQTDALSDYIPLSTGKYITYRIDSTVFTNFGRTTEVHKYQVKHVIESQIEDNLGRPGYRVFRYISNLNDTLNTTKTWTPDGTYFITPLSDQVELIEDNLRFIKLHLPIKDGFQWKGNKYLPPDPYSSLYNFSNDDNMEDWDFEIDNSSTSFSYQGKTYTDICNIEEADEAYNIPITDPNSYASKTRALEKYSKNIGLVYREYELWEYQPNTSGSGGPYKTGFIIKMWMIDHN